MANPRPKLIKKGYAIRDRISGNYSDGQRRSPAKWPKTPKIWRRLSDVKSQLSWLIIGNQGQPKEDAKQFANLDIVEMEILYRERDVISAEGIVEEEKRRRFIQHTFGWQIEELLTRLLKQDKEEYRYILVFHISNQNYYNEIDISSDSESFVKIRAHLKELGIPRKNYRYTYNLMVFKKKEDAVLVKLTYPEIVVDVYDLVELKQIDVQEELKKRS